MPINFKRKGTRGVMLKQWRKFQRDVLFPLSIFSFLIIFILLSPVLIPLACLSYAVGQKRMYLVAEGFRCIKCNVVLGKASIDLADIEWARYRNELYRQNPEYHFRMERTVHAICTECEKQYRFCEKAKVFIESQIPDHRCNEKNVFEGEIGEI